MKPSALLNPRSLLALALFSAPPLVVEAGTQFEAPFLAWLLPTSSRGVAIADFNEDGRLDVAVNARNGNFTLRLGDGVGGLGALTMTSHTTTTSSSIVSGDLNQDGHLDLVLAYGPAASVCVYLGWGNGMFGTRTDYPAPGGTQSVTLGDFNEDGNLDVAATTAGIDAAGWVCVWMGQADGTLAGRLDLYNDDIPMELVAADINDDGHGDLIYSDRYAAGTLRIYPGHGDGSFGALLWCAAFLYPTGVASADVNGDGHADCIVANTDDFSIMVNLGHGDGTFSWLRYEVGGRPRAVAIGDFNGDGQPDMAVADYADHYAAGGNAVTILLNTGTGGFVRFADLPVTSNPNAIQTGDLNGDGHLDLVLTCQADPLLVALFGHGDGTFGVPSFGVGASPTALAAGDFNGDSRPDVVTVNEYDATLSLRLGLVGREFAPRVDHAIPAYPGGVTTGDLNHDGLVDVVVAGGGIVSVFTGDGAGNLGVRADFAVVGGTRTPQLADLDHDGNIDLVVAHPYNSFVSLLLGNGAGGLASPITLATPSETRAVQTADFNADGLPDLVTANYAAGSISLFLNLGGGFAPPVNSPSGTGPWDLATGDIDQDGKLDLAVANNLGQSVSIFRGDGLGGLTRLADVTGIRYPQGVALLDANHDTRLDLVVTRGNMALVHYGDGLGTFTLPEYYGAGIYPRGLTVADFDMDGEPDLAMPNYGNADSYSNIWPGSFSVLWNRGEPPVAVSLLSFNAARAGAGAQLSWEVSEDNQRHLYELFRKVGSGPRDAVTATPITGRTHYEILDSAVPAGPVDYWLRETTPMGVVSWLGPFQLLDSPPAAARLALQPNPARGPVTLTFGLAVDIDVRVAVYDASGRLVARLLERTLTAGIHQLSWDRRTDDGLPVQQGIYFVRLETPRATWSEKVLILN